MECIILKRWIGHIIGREDGNIAGTALHRRRMGKTKNNMESSGERGGGMGCDLEDCKGSKRERHGG